MSDEAKLREAFKVRIGDYLTEHELEGLGISADWFLYLSPTIAPSLATCFTQFNTYDLLACPCCGGGATIIGTYPTNEFSAICRGCGLETAHKLTPTDATSDWNKRHAPDDGPEGIEAALSVAQGQGWVMVPRVPTEAMLRAGLDSMWCRYEAAKPKAVYTAMLAAAPAQPDGVGK